MPTPGSPSHWHGAEGPAAAWALAQLARSQSQLVIAVAGGEQQAYRLEEELRFFLGDAAPVTHFPDSETLPYDPFSPHQEILSGRLAALYRLPRQTHGVLILTASTLLERMPPRAWLDGRALLVKVGETLDPGAFRERLVAAGYQSVSEVQTQGEFAVRGALIDLFPMGSTVAYRLDLFDDEIESIRSFDPDTQRSNDKVDEVRLLPGREFPTDKDGIEGFRRRYREYFPGDPARSRIYSSVSKGLMPAGVEAWLPLFFADGDAASLFDYLPTQAVTVELEDVSEKLAGEWKQIEERFERYSGNLERPLLRPADLYLQPQAAITGLQRFGRIQRHANNNVEVDADLGAAPLPSGKDAIKTWLQEHSEHRVLFVAESPGRREALLDWLKAQGVLPRQDDGWHDFSAHNNRYSITIGPLQESFTVDTAKLAVIAEAQVFGLTAPAAALRKRSKVRDPETILRDLNDLKPGAPVVHVEHGVGRYLGLQRLDAGGLETEYLVLEYASRGTASERSEAGADAARPAGSRTRRSADAVSPAGGDKLYVPVASLNLIHRYTGAEPDAAPLHALGNERWAKARNRARDRAADVAAELLQIQARRAARPGRALIADGDDYRHFCRGFPFETTPDQQTAIDAVLADLAKPTPMDRVVCGDVGFGKTEVALRAAFVAASAGYQVCVLAPTTLLVQQHEKNFRDRFSDSPIKVVGLSRLRTAREQAKLLEDVTEKRVDIIIGTHRLLQDDVRFANLGLVVIDEEHRFGVRHKEKLKNLRAEVDLLTLTATPIPRTLNMSLAGLRELSIIATPPESRLSIRTFVAEWDTALVQEACLRELKRGGQVYFLHNEVRSIQRFADDISKLVPEARVRVAHGQMRERELEQVMLDFYHGRFNILVCSTIIESGIDVPTANTILIDRADNFGLAQLHQLRGRVGRSHHRAYAYLFVPSKRALSADAERRLEAIEQLDELGAGFALATQDLEIRGAGELLGDSQSGQIEEIGFTLYAELLSDAVRAIRSGTLDDAPFSASGRGCEVDLGASALIPEDYMPDVHTRLVLYKRIAETRNEDDLDELKVEMIDRFGLLPPQTQLLFETAGLRQRGEQMGLAKIRAGSSSATLEFGPQPRVDPAKLIQLIQSQSKVYKLEGQQRLHIRAELGEPTVRAERIGQVLSRLDSSTATPA